MKYLLNPSLFIRIWDSASLASSDVCMHVSPREVSSWYSHSMVWKCYVFENYGEVLSSKAFLLRILAKTWLYDTCVCVCVWVWMCARGLAQIRTCEGDSWVGATERSCPPESFLLLIWWASADCLMLWLSFLSAKSRWTSASRFTEEFW